MHTVTLDGGCDDPLDPRSARLIDALCDEFEARWRTGEAPRIEDYLSAVPAEVREPALGELLALELELRHDSDTPPDIAEYLVRFAGSTPMVHAAFEPGAGAPPEGPAPPPDLDDDRAMPAERRARFRILRLLRHGGTGDLFVAYDRQLDREVALKQVLAELAEDPECRRRLEAEAKITGALEHPGVAPVHVAGYRANGEPYFVMRLIRDRSLKEEIRSFHESAGRRPSYRALVERLVDVANTIAFAHSRGVIHRDIKPSNILIGEYGETVVVDWGLAKRIGQHGDEEGPSRPDDTGPSARFETRGGSVLGTPGYLSPEQAAGRLSEIGPASDVYSIGCTLYHVLTGRPPFEPDQPLEVSLDEVRKGEFTRPRELKRGIPRDLEAICLKAMATDPASRYAAALELAADLERWLADEPVSARREPWSDRIGRWTRRHRSSAVFLLATTFAASVLATILWQRSVSDDRVLRERVEALRTAENAAAVELIKILPAESGRSLGALVEALKRATNPEERLRLSLGVLRFDASGLQAVAEFALDARSGAVRLTANQLLDSNGLPGVVPSLWQTLEDPGQDPRRRFRAAGLLAAFVPDDDRWASLAGFLWGQFEAEALQDPGAYADFRELMRPVKRSLLPAIVAAYRPDPGGVRAESRRRLALAYLLDAFANDPEALACFIPDSDGDDYRALLDLVTQERGRIVPRLIQFIQRTVVDWPDEGRSPDLPEPDPGAVRAVQDAGGRVADRFAYCLNMPLAAFLECVEQLRASGYRPLRIRPAVDRPGGRVRVAAVWARDSRSWTLRLADSAEGLQRWHERRAAGSSILDVAGVAVPGSGGRPDHRYFGVWADGHALGGTDEASGRGVSMFARETWIDGTPYIRPTRIAIGTTDGLASGEVPLTRQSFRGADGTQFWCQIVGECRPEDAPLAPFTGDLSGFLDRCMHGGGVSDVAIGEGPGGTRQYSAVWTAGGGLDARVVRAETPEVHREACDRLADQGFRPIGVGVAPEGTEAVSVWQHPAIYENRNGPPDRRVAVAAITLLRLGVEAPVWPLFRHSTDPGARSYLIQLCAKLGVSADRLIARERAEIDVSARTALIQALAQYPIEAIAEPERAGVIGSLARRYRDESDAGLHAALGLLMDRWGGPAIRGKIDLEESGLPIPGDRRWLITRQGLAMSIIPGPVEFVMGRPTWLRAEDQQAHPHRVRIDRSFAIGMHEVTRAQFERFLKESPEVPPNVTRGRYKLFSPEPDCPMTGLTWLDAARYCRWLDERDGVEEDQRCYPAIDEIRQGMTLPPDFLQRTGHRLPTEAEWEYAARAGATSPEFFGHTPIGATPPELLPAYAWCSTNAKNMTHPVGRLLPNDLGLFDVLGNAHEWCQDASRPYCRGRCQEVALDTEGLDRVIAPQQNRVLRGSWFGDAIPATRTDSRSWNWPIYPSTENGFRVARTLPAGERRRDPRD